LLYAMGRGSGRKDPWVVFIYERAILATNIWRHQVVPQISTNILYFLCPCEGTRFLHITLQKYK